MATSSQDLLSLVQQAEARLLQGDDREAHRIAHHVQTLLPSWIPAISGDAANVESAVVHHTLSGALVKLGEFGAAQTHAQQALVLLESAVTPDEPLLMVVLVALAGIHLYGASPRPELAPPLLHRALGIAQTRFGNDNPEVAGVLQHLAQAHLLQNRPNEARPLLRRVLEIYTQAHGEGAPQVATTLNAIAVTHLLDGHADNAIALLERALKLLGGASEPNAKLVVDNLVQAYQRVGRPDAAQALTKAARPPQK